MDYDLTLHALRRMILRDITEETLGEVLGHPHTTSPGRTPGTLVYDAIVQGDAEFVVVVEGTVPLRVVP